MTNDEEMKSKVFNVIRNARIDKYVNEEEEITSEGLTLWGYLNGKNTLKIESLKNLRLKIEGLQKEREDAYKDYNDMDLMVALYSSAIVNFGGKFTPEMQDLYNKLKNNCDGDPDEIDEQVYLRCINELNDFSGVLTPENANITGIIGDRKNVIKFMKAENASMESQMIEVKPRKFSINKKLDK
ncbi:MAG: hypothetical protein K6D97_01395 [Clostridia bacterium]|nr:hypothetical protein [Clostridia bacterium]